MKIDDHTCEVLKKSARRACSWAIKPETEDNLENREIFKDKLQKIFLRVLTRLEKINGKKSK